MTYRLVKAIAMGTIGLSTGMVRFEPENEDERYRFGVFTKDDADKVIRKGLGEDVGEASAEDFAAYVVLMTGDAPDPGRRLAEVLKNANAGSDDTEGGEDATPPVISKAAASAHLTAQPAGSRVANGVEAVGVRELRNTLRETSDLTVLGDMLKAEQSGKNRDSAVQAIEARIRAVSPASADEDVVEEGQSDGSGDGAETGGGDNGGGNAEANTNSGGDQGPAAAEEGAAATPASETEQSANAADAAPAATTSTDDGGASPTVDPEAAPVT